MSHSTESPAPPDGKTQSPGPAGARLPSLHIAMATSGSGVPMPALRPGCVWAMGKGFGLWGMGLGYGERVWDVGNGFGI